MEGYNTRYIGYDGAFIALGSLHLTACLDDLTESLWLDFHRCNTRCFGLGWCQHDFIRIHTMSVSVVVIMTFVSMCIVIVSIMSVGIMVVGFFGMVMAFVIMPFMIVAIV